MHEWSGYPAALGFGLYSDASSWSGVASVLDDVSGSLALDPPRFIKTWL